MVTAAYACTESGGPVATCAGPVPPGSPIDTSVVGATSFTVNATDNQGDSASNTVNYTVIPVSPASLSFGPQLLGTASTPQTVRVFNRQRKRVKVSGVIARGDFRRFSGCPDSIAPGRNCGFSVRFTPKGIGTRPGRLTVNEGQTSFAVSLNGIGAQTKLSPASISFRPRVIGTTSAAKKLTLINKQDTPLNISGITIGGDFAESDTCGNQLQANARCVISVTFTPTTPKRRFGTLTVNGDAPIVSGTVSLSGSGLSRRSNTYSKSSGW